MKTLLITFLLIAIYFAFPSVSLAQKASEEQLIIKFKSTTPQALIEKKLKENNMHVIETIDELSAFVVTLPVGKERALIKKLNKDKLILYAEPNYLYTYESTGSVENTQSLMEQIHLRKALKMKKGKNIKIAVIDSGFNLHHPALAGKDTIWIKNFSADKTLEDELGHGTSTAGIITARNTPKGIEGICPNCQLLLVKLGEVPNSRIVSKGIIWAVKNGARVINLSIVTEGYSHLTEETINYAWEKGAVIVAAAGNQHAQNKVYPAAYNNVVSVASVDENNQKAPFSNYGSWVTIAAPGVNVYSTHRYGQYGSLSGTSISAPIVAGVAALVWDSAYGTSNTSVVERLCATAEKIEGTGEYWQCGLINADAALTSTKAKKGKLIGNRDIWKKLFYFFNIGF